MGQEIKGSRVFLAVEGLVQNDGAKITLGLALMLAGPQIVRGAVRAVNGDLRSEGRLPPPILVELASGPSGSSSRTIKKKKRLICDILEASGFASGCRKPKAKTFARRLEKYDIRKLDKVLSTVKSMT